MKTTQIVNTIIELYPSLEKDKNRIMRHVYKKKECENIEVPQHISPHILDRFIHNDSSYYRDPNGSIIDKNINIVGTYEKKNDEINYFFFEEIKKKIDLLRTKSRFYL